MRKNPDVETEMVEVDDWTPPDSLAPWYQQFVRLDEAKRTKLASRVLDMIKEKKPETFEFIKKFKCKLVGVSPRIVYTLLNERDGDLSATWIHSFSMPSLLFWCPDGKFGFFVNPILDFDDTVLNKVKGNPKQRNIRGFTG